MEKKNNKPEAEKRYLLGEIFYNGIIFPENEFHCNFEGCDCEGGTLKWGVKVCQVLQLQLQTI